MKFKHSRTSTERQEASEDYIDLVGERPYLNIAEWSVNDIETDINQLGLSGSPTKVKKIENVVFQAKESKVIPADEHGIDELMKEKELSVADEVSAKEKIWHYKNEFHQLLHEATKILADRTKSLSIAMTGDNEIYHSGYANLLKMPEFYDIDVMRNVLGLIEEVDLLDEIFEFSKSENIVHVVYGAELGNKFLEPISVIYTKIDFGNQTCRLGVIGSLRFEYRYVIPLIKYLRGLLMEMGIKAV
jgi:transcriptional regulator of heat shock response